MSDEKLDELEGSGDDHVASPDAEGPRCYRRRRCTLASSGRVRLARPGAEGSASRVVPTSSAATSSARPTPAGAPAGRARTCAARRGAASGATRKRHSTRNVPVRLSAGDDAVGPSAAPGTRSAAPAVTTARRAAHRARSAAREASARTTGPVLRRERAQAARAALSCYSYPRSWRRRTIMVLLLARVAGRLDRRLRTTSTCRRVPLPGIQDRLDRRGVQLRREPVEGEKRGRNLRDLGGHRNDR